ncbi:MAG: hypothetical protein AAFO04_26740 [Cyanobacteria bacterium J06592_8]
MLIFDPLFGQVTFPGFGFGGGLTTNPSVNNLLNLTNQVSSFDPLTGQPLNSVGLPPNPFLDNFAASLGISSGNLTTNPTVNGLLGATNTVTSGIPSNTDLLNNLLNQANTIVLETQPLVNQFEQQLFDLTNQINTGNLGSINLSDPLNLEALGIPREDILNPVGLSSPFGQSQLIGPGLSSLDGLALAEINNNLLSTEFGLRGLADLPVLF